MPPCAFALRPIARLGYQAGVPLTQISRLLGHASLTTTQRYLNLDLDLDVTVSDFIPFQFTLPQVAVRTCGRVSRSSPFVVTTLVVKSD